MQLRESMYILAIIALGIAVLYLLKDIDEGKKRPTFLTYDEPFIELAIAQRSRETKQNQIEVMEGRYPIAVRLRDEICIALQLEKGSVGGSPVYCFARKDKTLTRKYTEVE